jgi:hypothetical protein
MAQHLCFAGHYGVCKLLIDKLAHQGRPVSAEHILIALARKKQSERKTQSRLRSVAGNVVHMVEGITGFRKNVGDAGRAPTLMRVLRAPKLFSRTELPDLAPEQMESGTAMLAAAQLHSSSTSGPRMPPRIIAKVGCVALALAL